MAVDGNDTSLKDFPKLSHKKWKALKKKEKRKAARQAQAKEQEKQADESPKLESSDDERQQELKQQNENDHRQWLEREKEAQKLWQLKKEREEREKEKIEEQKRKIQEEWEEREKQEAKEQEEREKKEEEKRVKQDALLKEATANENKSGDTWHNPIAPTNYGREQLRETCPFFKKTGACRFGERCSRGHPEPDGEVTTLLFPGMYSHFELEQTLRDEYDTDIGLEYEEGETYQHFKDFYEDVLPEFKKCGRVIQFKVCCNYEPHLRGNVYVQFRREEEAQTAFAAFNGRFYGGKQLSAQFVDIERWKLAICGLYGSHRCPKGKNCNFLHVFGNPNNEFRSADFDHSGFGQRSERSFNDGHRNGYNSSRRSYSHRRSRSRERTTRSRSHRRSRSRSRLKRRSISRSPSKKRSRSPSRKKSRSPSRKRSRSPSKKSMSISPKRRLRSLSRNRSRSPSRRRSRSRDRRRISPGRGYSKLRRLKSRSRSRPRKKSELNSRSRSKSPNSLKDMNCSRRRSLSRTHCDSKLKNQMTNSLNKDINTVLDDFGDIPLPVINSSEILQKQDNRRPESPETDKHSHRRKNKKHKKDRQSSYSDFKCSESVDTTIKDSVKNVSQSLNLTNSPSKLELVKDIIQQSLAE